MVGLDAIVDRNDLAQCSVDPPLDSSTDLSEYTDNYLVEQIIEGENWEDISASISPCAAWSREKAALEEETFEFTVVS